MQDFEGRKRLWTGSPLRHDLAGPCRDCPFLVRDFAYFRTPGRAAEIVESFQQRGVWPCHKTAQWDDEGQQQLRPGTQACAGGLIMLAHDGDMGIMQRLAVLDGTYDPSGLHMSANVFRGTDSFVQHHVERCGRRRADPAGPGSEATDRSGREDRS